MQWVDYAIIAVVGISVLVGLFRGFVREAISVLGWLVAFWVALTFMDVATEYLEPYIEATSLRRAAGFGVLFLAVLVITALTNALAGLLIDKTGLGGTDRGLGMVFGAARGVLVVAGLVLLAGVTAMPQDRWWRESVLIEHFEVLALEIRELLPSDISSHFDFAPPGLEKGLRDGAPRGPPDEPSGKPLGGSGTAWNGSLSQDVTERAS